MPKGNTLCYSVVESMPTKSYVQRYLATKVKHGAVTRHKIRYHVVRSSFGQRRVPFGKWAGRIKDEFDVLLDFSSREPVQIRLNHRYVKNMEYMGNYPRLGWYFLDSHGKKIPCCSGYEALFAAYLKSNDIPFEYQNWVMARRSTVRSWILMRNDSLQPNALSYVPDFYLPATDEFVELKGWQPRGRKQAKAIQYLTHKGYRIHILEWEDLRKFLGISVSYETCLNRAKKDFSQPSRAFADPRWVKERLSEA